MTQARGAFLELLGLFEATFGTTPAITPGDSVLLPIESESLSASKARDDNPHLNGNLDFGVPLDGLVDAGGDLPFRINPLAHGFFLKLLLGEPATTGADPYEHVFTKPAAEPSATFEKGFTDNDDYFLYTGVTAAKLTMTIDAKESTISATMSLMAAGRTVATSSFDSAPTKYLDDPFNLTAVGMALTEGGGAIAGATMIEFDIDRQLDGESGYTLANQGKRSKLPPGRRRVSGKLTTHFEDTDLFDKAVNSTESAIVITLQEGDGLGSAGNEKLIITFPEVYYDEVDPQVGDDGGVDVELPFRSVFQDGGDATAVKMQLFNAIASY